MNYDEIAFLEITSWQGVSIGAEHYYGKIITHNPYSHVELKRKLTAKQAAKLSKKDKWDYRPGAETDRFDTKEQIIKIAVAQYKSIMPSARMLVLGSSSSVEPKQVLDANKSIMEKCNKIYAEFEKIPWINRGGFWYRNLGDEEKIEELTTKWKKIISLQAEAQP